MPAVQTQPDYPRGLTFETVWAALMEDREQLREYAREQKEDREQMKEYTRELKEDREQMKEYTRELKERNKELEHSLDNLSKNVGGLNNTVGALIETLFAAHLWEKFPEYDLHRAYQRIKLYDKNKAIAEIDILLVNTEWAMAVEVKREADKRDVDDHVVRMGRILQYPTKLIEPQVKLLGAIAAGVIAPEVAAYAHECGFFALELKGESVIRVPAPAGFKPKEFR